MTPHRPNNAAVWAGAFVVAFASIWLELLVYRLIAATAGEPLAFLLAVAFPSAAGLGAAAMASRSGSGSPARLVRRAAALVAVAGLGVAGGVVGLAWVTSIVASAKGEAAWWHVGVLAVGWLVAGAALGAAAALFLRHAVARVGRLCFVTGAGGAVGSLALPLAMWLDAPRAALALVVLLGVLASWLGWSVRDSEPRLALQPLFTLPLAGLALLAGDIGQPWLRVRLDLDKRRNITLTAWTELGTIAVDRPTRGQATYTVDRSEPRRIHIALPGDPKPGFRPEDFGYGLNDQPSGAVLILGSGGGRAVRVALSHGYQRVDVVEQSAAMVHGVVNGRLGPNTGYILGRAPLVTLRIGAGRAQLVGLRAEYERIVVIGDPPLNQAAPRMIPATAELFTVEAIKSYLERLAPGGNVVLRVAMAELPGVLAGARQAIGAGGAAAGAAADKRLMACHEHLGWGVVMLRAGDIEPRERHELERLCKQKRLTRYFPLPEARQGDRQRGEKLARLGQREAEIGAARAPSDDRPFGAARRPLWDEVVASALALRPTRSVSPSHAEPPPASAGPRGLAVQAGALALLSCLLVLLVPVRGRLPGDPRAPLSLRLALPLYGLALALGMFAGTHHALFWLGDPLYAWTLVVPLTLVGCGSGRLLFDVVDASRRRLWAASLGAAGIVLLLAAHLLAPRLGPGEGSTVARLAGASGGVWLLAMVLGGPLGAALRSAARYGAASVGWAWGAHLSGWALGGALAALAIHYVGLAEVFTLSAAAFGLATMLLALAPTPAAPEEPA